MNTDPSWFLAGLKMLTALALVLGALLLLYVLGKRLMLRHLGGTGERPMRILSSTPLGPKKSLCMVQIPGMVLVLGLTGDRISLLARLKDLSPVREKEPPMEGPAPSFPEHLRRWTTGVVKKPESALTTADGKDPLP